MTKSASKRVVEYGEVFTPKELVNSILESIHHETIRIDSRILEPACGDGNFLSEILERKLSTVRSQYAASQLKFERHAIQAASSIYGVEILEDNVEKCRSRLSKIIAQAYNQSFPDTTNSKFFDVTEFIMSRNILWGDFLTQTGCSDKKPMIFSEWIFFDDCKVNRSDYTLQSLVDYRSMGEDILFSDKNRETIKPKPIQQFHPVHFLEIANAEHHPTAKPPNNRN